MDARRTPIWILCDHLEDQVANLFRDSTATTGSCSHFAEHGPVPFEPSPVPPSNRFRLDEKERLLPLGPDPAHKDPKQLIDRPQSWPGMLAFQDGELLPESEVF
jgi:hypothetical protein